MVERSDTTGYDSESARCFSIPEGWQPHVHLLVGLRATHCLADFMRELKKASSAWIHGEIGQSDFARQEGHAAFTVSPNMLPVAKNYIARQEEHHRVETFQEELIRILTYSRIAFDPKHFD